MRGYDAVVLGSAINGGQWLPEAVEYLEPLHYHDRDHDSGVAAYESSADLIRVQFRDGSIYRYTAASAGSASRQS